MLSGNVLKLIAAVSMLSDHIGLMFFPEIRIFRIFGRLAYPIFAYMIGEGCRYTRNKRMYIAKLLIVAFLCQMGYFIYEGSLDMCIMVTFSLSVAVAFSLQRAQLAQGTEQRFLRYIELAGAVAGVWIANSYLDIDYGFWGCIIPVLPLLVADRSLYVKGIVFGAGLVILAWDYGGVQWYSLLALPLIGLYNQKRGRYNLKYFFYIFYPAHLVVLELIKNVT